MQCSQSRKINHRKFIHDRIIANLHEQNRVFINDKERVNILIVNNYDNLENFIFQNTCSLSEQNVFKDTLRKVHMEETSIKQLKFAEQYLQQKRSKLIDLLKQGSVAYERKEYEKALDYFESGLQVINKDCYPDEFELTPKHITAIKYAIILCNYALNTHGSLLSAISQLMYLIDNKNKNDKFPLFYLTLAQIHFTLKHYEICSNVILTGLQEIGSKNLTVLYWPGTEKLINDPTPGILKTKMEALLTECKCPKKPDAYCYYQHCLTLGHCQKAIYFESPSFTGYVILTCTIGCQFIYHVNCWQKFCRIAGGNNSILNASCNTFGCDGSLESFKVFDGAQNLKTIKVAKTSNDTLVQNKEDSSSGIEQLSINSISSHKKEKLVASNYSSELITECTEEKMTDISSNGSENSSVKSFNLNVNVPEFKPRLTHSLSLNHVPKKVPVAVQTEKRNVSNTFSQCSVNISQQATQTDADSNAGELKYLRTYVRTLSESLYQAENSYNILLREKKCPNCKRDSNEFEESVTKCDKAIQSDTTFRESSTQTSCPQEWNMNMGYTAQVACRDKINYTLPIENFIHNQTFKYELQIKELSNEISRLRQANAFLVEQEKNLKFATMQIRSILLHELHHSRSAFNQFLSFYKDKCNRVIWEMKDLCSLVTPETTPTIAEVNIAENNWMQSLMQTTHFCSFVQEYYETVLNKLSNPNYSLDNMPLRPQFEIPTEPQHLCSQYFKALLHMNTKLERQITYQNSLLFQHRSVSPQHQSHVLSKTTPSCAGNNDKQEVHSCGNGIKPKLLNELSTDMTARSPPPNVTDNANNSFDENKTNADKSALNRFLKKSYPQIPEKYISNAISELRQKYGKLTGMTIKTIRDEVDQILKKQMSSSKGSQLACSNVENEQFKSTCSICFEFLDEKTIQLPCHHLFHEQCIRTWLSTNTICPICRIFTILD